MTVVDDVEEILQLFKKTEQQLGAGNFDAAKSFYAKDAVLMVPGVGALHGNEAIRAELERVYASAKVRVSLDISDIRVSPERAMAYAYGTATSSPGNVRTQWLAVLSPQP